MEYFSHYISDCSESSVKLSFWRYIKESFTLQNDSLYVLCCTDIVYLGATFNNSEKGQITNSQLVYYDPNLNPPIVSSLTTKRHLCLNIAI